MVGGEVSFSLSGEDGWRRRRPVRDVLDGGRVGLPLGWDERHEEECKEERHDDREEAQEGEMGESGV